MNKIWNTQEIKGLAEAVIAAAQVRIAALTPPTDIEVAYPGGDHDTETIRVNYPDDEWISIYGFHTEKCLSDGSQAEVEMLAVLTSPGDSAGGIQSDVEDINLTAQAIKSALMRDGWSVVGSMDKYF